MVPFFKKNILKQSALSYRILLEPSLSELIIKHDWLAATLGGRLIKDIRNWK